MSPAIDPKTFFINAWRPYKNEESFEITSIEGEIPKDIHGTLYRNGPSQKIDPVQGHQALHLFDGDGLIHSYRIDDGHVWYTGKYVRTPSFIAEQEEGRFCFSCVNFAPENPSDKVPLRETANTNIVWHGGKLMALVENAWPYLLDPRTLDTIGREDFQGKMLGMATSAHPKIDARRGRMIIHGYQPFQPYVQYYEVESDGTCVVAEPIDTPYAVMMHDIAITENYAIILLCPIVYDGDKLMQSGMVFGDAIQWAPERGLRFGIRRRGANAEVRWFDAPTPGFIFHPGNAYEEGNKIVMDACTYLEGQALIDSLRTWRRGIVKPVWTAKPFLYEFDLETGKCSEKQLDERGAEFPRLDDRLVGYKNRFGYSALNRTNQDDPLDTWSTIVKYDRQGGPSAIHDFGKATWPSEPVFVPRSADAAEDDGFVLNVVYDGATDRSYLSILDAGNLSGKPIAKAHLPHRLPVGFHGNFAPGIV
jgi:carotenoid cleavage dioxygenase